MAESPDPIDQDDLSTESFTRESSKSDKKGGKLGSGLYVTRYAFQRIFHQKHRSLSLLIGVVIGVALVTSVFVWTDTGSLVAIDDYFARYNFHYFVRSSINYPFGDSQTIFPLKQWVDEHPTTKSSHIVYYSIGLLEVTPTDELNPYLPWPYARGIKDCSVFFTDNDFLSKAESSFSFTGTFRLQGGQVLLSQRVVDDAQIVLGLEISVGSRISVAIAQYYSHINRIIDLHPLYITNLEVVGIYDIAPMLDPLHQAFPSTTRQNWGPNDADIVFGLVDSMILSRGTLQQEHFDTIAERVDVPRLLVEVDPTAFYEAGLSQTGDILESLFTQIESRFSVFLGGRLYLFQLEQYVLSFERRRTMGVLLAPILILSIFTTIFTTTLYLSGRRQEVGILRSRGASYRQLYAMLFLEFLILAIIGIVLGSVLGVFIGCTLPAATGFLQFDLNEMFRYLALAQFQPFTLFSAFCISVLPSLVFIFLDIRSFLKNEVYEQLRGNRLQVFSDIRLQMIYVVGVFTLFIPFTYIIQILQLETELAFAYFMTAVVLWVVLCDAGARVLKAGIAGFSRVIRPIFGQKSTLFAKSVKVRRSRIIPLLVILILTFSVTIFSAVEAQTYQTNLERQIDYYIGADIRVYSGRVHAQRVDEIIALPFIRSATAVIEVKAEFAGHGIKLFGIDPQAYSQIGKWDESSFSGENPQEILAAMTANPDGIILPKHLADDYNRHTGENVTLDIWDQIDLYLENKTFTVLGEVYSAPGFGYSTPLNPAAAIASPPGFGFQENKAYAFCHINYFLFEAQTWKGLGFVNLTQTFLAGIIAPQNYARAIASIQSLDFVYHIWSPYTFDLRFVYPDGYLFAQGVISLLSVGFLAALTVSIIALSVFVSTITAERKTEYAIMRALGGTRSQVTAIVMGEFFGLILAAFLLSLVLGSGFAWLLMFALLRIFPQPYIIPFQIITPLTLLLAMLGLVVLGLIVGAYLPARRAGRIPVSQILRNL